MYITESLTLWVTQNFFVLLKLAEGGGAFF